MTDLTERLRNSATGYKEWRVQNPVDGAYCMSFSKRDSINPEIDAREWLEDHQRAYPESRFSQYVVTCADMMTDGDKLMSEAATEIEHLALDLQTERAAVVALRAEIAGLRKSAALRVQFHAAELADVIAERDHAVEQAAKNADEVLRLRAEVAGLREDAERWRMVRDECLIEPGRNVGNGKSVTMAWWMGIDIPTKRKASRDQDLNALDKRLTQELIAARKAAP